MSFMMIPAVVVSLGYSGNYKGAWIYETIPARDKSSINKGALKAAIVSLFMPVYLLVSIGFLILYRMEIIDQLIVVGINMFLFIIIIFNRMGEFLPFSKAFQVSENPSGGVKVFFTLFLMAGFALLHFIITMIPYGTYIYIPLGLIGSKLFWKRAIS